MNSSAQSQRRGRRPKGNSSNGRLTLLQRWLDENGFTSAQLEGVTGISRQQMTKIRAGADVRKKTMIRILRGCCVLASNIVRMEEIFDLDPYSPDNLRLVPAA